MQFGISFILFYILNLVIGQQIQPSVDHQVKDEIESVEAMEILSQQRSAPIIEDRSSDIEKITKNAAIRKNQRASLEASSAAVITPSLAAMLRQSKRVRRTPAHAHGSPSYLPLDLRHLPKLSELIPVLPFKEVELPLWMGTVQLLSTDPSDKRTEVGADERSGAPETTSPAPPQDIGQQMWNVFVKDRSDAAVPRPVGERPGLFGFGKAGRRGGAEVRKDGERTGRSRERAGAAPLTPAPLENHLPVFENHLPSATRPTQQVMLFDRIVG